MIASIITKYRVRPETRITFKYGSSKYAVDFYEVHHYNDKPNQLTTYMWAYRVNKDGNRATKAYTREMWSNDAVAQHGIFLAETEVKEFLEKTQPPF